MWLPSDGFSCSRLFEAFDYKVFNFILVKFVKIIHIYMKTYRILAKIMMIRAQHSCMIDGKYRSLRYRYKKKTSHRFRNGYYNKFVAVIQRKFKMCAVWNVGTHISRTRIFSIFPSIITNLNICFPPGCGRSVTDFWGWGAQRAQVTLLPLCEWWYVWTWSTRRGLKPYFYRLSRRWSLWRSSPTREISRGRTLNRIRDLMASSQKLWPPIHEDGPEFKM
jgi:hypothetical protein